ncbi:MAG: hypothetical protein ABI604_15125, partial [Nitrospirota bacterium]
RIRRSGGKIVKIRLCELRGGQDNNFDSSRGPRVQADAAVGASAPSHGVGAAIPRSLYPLNCTRRDLVKRCLFGILRHRCVGDLS